MAIGLEDIKVIQTAQWAAGPMCGRLLADWGADVIFIEHPTKGDVIRGIRDRAFNVQQVMVGRRISTNIDHGHQHANRNKRSVTLDLSQEAGREIVYKLLAEADVFVTNLRPFEMERFKLEYDTLSQLNPRLIYGSLTGFGKKGPDRNNPAYDVTAYWTRAGIPYVLSTTGMPGPGFRPAFGDNLAGVALAFGIMTALFVRERTGVGQEVDLSLLHAGIYQISFDIAGALATGLDFREEMARRREELRKEQGEEQDEERVKLRDKLVAEAEAAVAGLSSLMRGNMPNPLAIYYDTKDGRRILFQALQPDRYWSRFCRAIGREDLEHDPRFDSMMTRRENSAELTSILDEVFLSKTLDEWKPLLGEIPWAPAQTILEVINDPQARANDFFVRFDHPTYGRIEVIANPVKLSKNPASVRLPAPEHGQHTEEVLLEYGYTWEDIVQFKEQGVIA